jgi:hypothetical protein
VANEAWKVAGNAGAGTALALSLTWPWTRTGVASALSARRLAQFAMAGDARELVDPWMGRLWYAGALSGAVLVVLSPWQQRAVRRARLAVLLVGWASVLPLVIGLRITPGKAGAGAMAAVFGLVAATALVAFDRIWRSRAT